MNLRLTPRLALVFILFALGILAGVGILAYYSGRILLETATKTELQSTALEKEAALETWIIERESSVAALARSPYILEKVAEFLESDPNSKTAHDTLVRELAVHTGPGQSFLTLFVLSPEDGRVIASVDPSEAGDLRTNLVYFIEGKRGTYTTPVYYSPDLLVPAMTTAAPLHSTDGKLLGVLAGRLNLEELNAIVQRRSGLRETDDAFLVNTSKLFVTQPRFLPDAVVLQEGVHTEPVQRCLAGSSATMSEVDYRGIPVIAVYRWLSTRQMCLIVKLSHAEALAPVEQFGTKVVWIAIGTLAAASIAALLLSNALLRPIRAMQIAAQRYGHGDLNIRLPETRHDELGVLAHEFNQMAGSLAHKEMELREHARTLEQKVQERTKALQESNNQLHRAEEIANIGSWEWLIAENRVTWSDGLYKVFGLQSQEFGATYEAYLEHVQPDDREHVRYIVDAAYYAGGSFEFESRIIRRDGEIRYLYTRGKMELGQPDRPARMIGIAIDITERRQVEDTLRESEDKFKYLFDHSIIGKSITFPDGTMDVNAAFCAMLGYSETELKNKKWQEITHPEDVKASQEIIAPILAGTTNSTRFSKRYLHKNGSVVWTDVSTVLRRDQDGRPLYFLTAMLDITERKQAEETLQRLTEELRRSNAELEQFAYVASHDLQEPLRMISSYMQLLSGRYTGKLDSDADEFIHYAVDGATRMQNLINDLLAYSRVGTRGNDPIPVSVENVLKDALANLEFAIEESGIKITHDALPVVCGDPLQLVMVFQNLIGNAIKFRGPERPYIHVGAQREGGEWLFSVHDNGIGFDQKFADRVFVIFQRLNTRSAFPGTGIGLAICKRIILRHGGRIWVESERGQGSVFYFTLPALEAV